jgi:hypothetical protein
MLVKIWCATCHGMINNAPAEPRDVNDLMTAHAMTRHREESRSLIVHNKIMKEVDDVTSIKFET